MQALVHYDVEALKEHGATTVGLFERLRLKMERLQKENDQFKSIELSKLKASGKFNQINDSVY